MTGLQPEATVDVVIPAYGRPDYLREAIESVLAQTYSSWRLTVGENGPGGGDVEAAVTPFLSDPRINYVVAGRNLGAARNAANLVESTSARYVGLLHDDDLWSPEFLERRVAFLEENPTCGLVFSGCRVIDGQGNEVFRTDDEFRNGLQPRRRFLRTLYRSNVIYIPTVLVPRSVYATLGTFRDDVLFYDYEMWLRIASRFDVGYLAGWDAAYRIHPTQLTHREHLRLGELRLRLLDELDAQVAAALPALDRRRARSSALLHVAADAIRRRDPLGATTAAFGALAAYPASVVDPRLLSGVLHAVRRRRRVQDAWRTPTKGESPATPDRAR
jgi:glycosyltransferase involved in cell wall biosynthesis